VLRPPTLPSATAAIVAVAIPAANQRERGRGAEIPMIFIDIERLVSLEM
jgi:hypothetical protein